MMSVAARRDEEETWLEASDESGAIVFIWNDCGLLVASGASFEAGSSHTMRCSGPGMCSLSFVFVGVQISLLYHTSASLKLITR